MEKQLGKLNDGMNIALTVCEIQQKQLRGIKGGEVAAYKLLHIHYIAQSP